MVEWRRLLQGQAGKMIEVRKEEKCEDN